MAVTRLAFAVYFITLFWLHFSNFFPRAQTEFTWLLYLIVLYLVAEKLYSIFRSQGIDLTFAWPLLFFVYLLSGATLFLGSQDDFPLLNRAEHYICFILITYIIWVFFTKYLPQAVWIKHPYYTAILVLAISSLAGVLNEIFEVTSDFLLNTHMVGLQYDTSLDLLMNILGSITFLGVWLIISTSSAPNKSVE
ncbi:MAG: hypothetical protein Q8P73_05055 [bacterium]|nr:hypothetical protein [bacterium]MDZ4342310.1 hypothetical protein [Candidatus Binatia bacterium]